MTAVLKARRIGSLEDLLPLVHIDRPLNCARVGLHHQLRDQTTRSAEAQSQTHLQRR